MAMTPVILGMALLLQPASPDAGLDCAWGAASAAEREAIADGMATGEATAVIDAAGMRLRECAIRAGHDEATGPGFIALAFSELARSALRGRLAAQGIDPALIESWFAAQDAATRIAIPDEAQGERVVLELNAAGVPMEALQQHAEMVGNYLATLIIPERVRRGLPPQ